MIFSVSKMAQWFPFSWHHGTEWHPLFALRVMDGFLRPLLFVAGWRGPSYHLWAGLLLIRFLHRPKLSCASPREPNMPRTPPAQRKSTVPTLEGEMARDSSVHSSPFLSLTPEDLISLGAGGKLNILKHFSLSRSVLSGQAALEIKEQGRKSLHALIFWCPDSPIRLSPCPAAHKQRPGPLQSVAHGLRAALSLLPARPCSARSGGTGGPVTCLSLLSGLSPATVWGKISTVLLSSDKTPSNDSYLLTYSLFKDIWRRLPNCLLSNIDSLCVSFIGISYSIFYE